MDTLYSILPSVIGDPIADFFASERWAHLFFRIQLASGILCVVLVAAIVYLVIKSNALGAKMEAYSEAFSQKSFTVPKKKMLKKWTEIQQRAQSTYEADYKLALLDADKLFDETLKIMGFAGKDMGERLKMVNSKQLSNIDDVWWAHKLRNQMVHETRSKTARGDVQRAIATFERSLKEFEALD
jgi:hypothetical protein